MFDALKERRNRPEEIHKNALTEARALWSDSLISPGSDARKTMNTENASRRPWPRNGKILSAAPPLALLSAREEEVLGLLAQGKLYKEIADELRISFSAVHKHQHALFRKLRVQNRTEAVLKWVGAANQTSSNCELLISQRHRLHSQHQKKTAPTPGLL